MILAVQLSYSADGGSSMEHIAKEKKEQFCLLNKRGH